VSLPAGPEFDALRAEYRQGLAAKLDALRAQWAQLAGGDSAALDPLVRALHTLAGSAGTFGFAQIGTAARAAEDFLHTKDVPFGPEDKREFNRLLQDLRARVLSGL